jgi:hypothetical protein
MSTQSDSDGSNEERYERVGLEGAGQGSQGAGQGSQGAEQLGEEARLNSKEMSAKLAAKELETLQVNCTAKNQHQKFKTNIPRKVIARAQSQFPHSCVCERFIYSHDGFAYSAAGNMWIVDLTC